MLCDAELKPNGHRAQITERDSIEHLWSSPFQRYVTACQEVHQQRQQQQHIIVAVVGIIIVPPTKYSQHDLKMVQKYQSPVRVYKYPFELVMLVSRERTQKKRGVSVDTLPEQIKTGVC